MKLPVDKKYMRIVFHVIVAFVGILVANEVMKLIFTIIKDLDNALDAVSNFFGGLVSIFLPLVIGGIIAYLLEPLTKFYQKKWNLYVKEKKVFEPLTTRIKSVIPKKKENKKNDKKAESSVIDETLEVRTEGTLLTFITFFTALSMGINYLIKSIAKQTSASEGSSAIDVIVGFVETTVESLTTQIELIEEEYAEFLESVGLEDLTSAIFTAITDGLIAFLNFFSEALLNIVGSLAALSGFLVTTVLGFILAFYLLQHKDAFKKNTLYFVETIFPDKFGKKLVGIFAEIHEVFSGYIIGTLTDASIMAVLLTIGLSLVGVPFASVIAFISGFSNIIPFVGAFVGFVLAVISAFTTGDMSVVIGAIVVVLIIQQIDSLFIAPRVLGNSVEISPFLVLLSLSVGGALFGMLGMIVAVPVTAIIKIFTIRFMKRQNESKSVKRLLTTATSWEKDTEDESNK